jgi:LPPG:FO 2-phospho-L-lactate transferase
MQDPTASAAPVLPARITMLSGGVGGSRFAQGVRHLLRRKAADPASPTESTPPVEPASPTEPATASGPDSPAHGTPVPSLTCVVNTGDDMWLNGLRVCPDLDSLLYGLAGVGDRERGWGRADETERVSAELIAYGVGADWFTLGDLDLGTHIARTQLLREGHGLSAVTRRLSARWELGATLLPATEAEVETRVRLADGSTLHFEEWWVRHRATVPAQEFIHAGADGASPAPGVLEAIRDAEVVLLAPSNPIVSFCAILQIPGIAEALRQTSAPVIGLSPILGDSHVLGMAAQCLQTVGVEVSAAGVALHYGARSAGGLLDGWLVDTQDADQVARVEAAGVACAAVPLLMRSPEVTADMAQAALDLAARTRR